MSAPDLRLAALTDWVTRELAHDVQSVEVASADASFRRYFRVRLRDGASLIVMDAPPAQEDIGPYLHVGALLSQTGVHVPAVHAVDRERGFVLLEDLGTVSYLSALQDAGRADALCGEALSALARLQVRGRELQHELSPYDEAALRRELVLMPEWFCTRHLQRPVSEAEAELFETTFRFLVAEALQQPQVFVHRDYHSRNLMVLPAHGPGIIDFQDALVGPIGYDLASIFKDCYIRWPRDRVETWVLAHRQALLAQGARMLTGANDAEFLRWFDLVSVQRHIKILGIFARLWWRDGKSGYLADLPLTVEYLQDSARRYAELAALGDWLQKEVAPQLGKAHARALAGRA
ncbi:MAG: aminoglycoside phosphotransferase family protein [Nevskiaceae bacterium]